MKYCLYPLVAFCLIASGIISFSGCSDTTPEAPENPVVISEKPEPKTVPHDNRWGIYTLDLTTEDTELLYSSASKIQCLSLDSATDMLAFSQYFGGDTYEYAEICTFNLTGGELSRLTNNDYMDLYPVWSPDGARLAFLSLPATDLDIYIMERDGANPTMLYDSGSHDADIDWVGNRIVFTAGSRIWIMNDDGTAPVPVTDPPRAGEWGNANLPFGDYDPRLSPDGTCIAFERLEDDASPHGNYNFFTIGTDGSNETRLTDTGYSQGIAVWSHAGDKLVFVVAAIGEEGKYDIYMMNADGSGLTNVNPAYFPPEFLCHSPVFSADDSQLYFIGEWWE
jgi:dipeptidyl aminopeptidase/acylaminoacyl peptidase